MGEVLEHHLEEEGAFLVVAEEDGVFFVEDGGVAHLDQDLDILLFRAQKFSSIQYILPQRRQQMPKYPPIPLLKRSHMHKHLLQQRRHLLILFNQRRNDIHHIIVILRLLVRDQKLEKRLHALLYHADEFIDEVLVFDDKADAVPDHGHSVRVLFCVVVSCVELAFYLDAFDEGAEEDGELIVGEFVEVGFDEVF